MQTTRHTLSILYSYCANSERLPLRSVPATGVGSPDPERLVAYRRTFVRDCAVWIGLGLRARLPFALTSVPLAARGFTRRITAMPTHGKKLRDQASDVRPLDLSDPVTDSTIHHDRQQCVRACTRGTPWQPHARSPEYNI